MAARFLVAITLLSLLSPRAARAAVKAPGPNRESPELVREVAAGKRTEANALWWGFNEDDATDSLQAAINSGARRLFVPNVGKEWVVRPITLASDQEICFGRGVVIRAKPGAFQGTGDCLFRAAGRQNLSLNGYGAVLQMRKKDYQGPEYAHGEWRHTLSFVSCSHVRVLGLTLRESGGDGIYLGSSGGAQPYCKDVLIRDVLCDAHHRQGISVISAEDLRIERTTLRDTGGTAPMAGIDLEPNAPGERLVNCILRDCVAEGNAGAGFVLYLAPLAAQSEPVSVTLENCRVNGSGGFGFGVSGSRTGGLRGLVRFVRCRSRDTGGAAVSVSAGGGDPMEVRFEGCRFASAGARRLGQAPITIAVRGGGAGVTQGGVALVDCVLEDRLGRPFLTASGAGTGAPPLAVRGRITVRGPFGARLHAGPGVDAAGLKVESIRSGSAVAVRLRPVSPEAHIATPPAPMAVRGAATYALYARRGETVSLAVTCRQVGKYADALSYSLLSPSGRSLGEGDLAPGETRELQCAAPEAGVFVLECIAGGNASEVRTANRLSLLVPADGVDLLQPQRSLYFLAPAGTHGFGFQVAGEGDAERAHAAVLDPAGIVKADQNGITGLAPYRFAIERRDARAAEVWSLRLGRPSQGFFEDVHLSGLNGIPPVVSFHPDALLVPE